MEIEIHEELVRAELTSVLSSPMFRDSERTSDLLRFVVDAALRNQSDQLKETFIAVSVYGRDASYDPKLDPIVRVQAGRLRSKLSSYYGGPGKTSVLRIDVPKGSYKPRFSAVDIVEPAPELENFAPQPAFDTNPHVHENTVLSPPRFKRSLMWLALVPVCLVGFLIWRKLHTPTLGNVLPLPVATSPGHNMQASVASDGQHFVYVRANGNSSANLYVTGMDGRTESRLTTDAAEDLHPSWSPDGRDIAFLRVNPTQSEIIVKPLYGTAETTLGSIRTPINLWVPDPSLIKYAPGPTWTPDGRSLIVTDNPDMKGFGLYSWSLQSGEKKRITSPGIGAEDIYPATSPDGKNLAFFRYTSGGSGDIFLVPLSGGSPTRLTFDSRDIAGLVWKPDSKSILFSSFRTGEHRLWEISINGGEPVAIPVSGRDRTEPALSSDGRLLLFTESTVNTSIWRIPLDGSKGNGNGADQIIESTRRNDSPQYSPDGQSIVFQSYRSGDRQLWIASQDGSNPRQLTHLNNGPLGGPRWSPDGQLIAFYALVKQHKQLFTANAKTGEIHQLLVSTSEDRSPNWSADGKWIYFNSDRDGSPACWKFGLEHKDVSKVASRICWDNFESADGRLLYFVTTEPGIWQVDLKTGIESIVPSLEKARVERYVAATSRGLYFVDYEDPQSKLQFFSEADGVVRTVGRLDGKLDHWDGGLSISPDGKYAVFTREDESVSEIDSVRLR